jgi:hypothetical protein
MMRVPYRVPFYPNKVGVHQLISWLAGGGHFIQEFHQKLWRNVFAGSQVGSWSPLHSQPRWTCFFRGMMWRASQWADTQTPVRPRSFKRLILLVKAATWGSLRGVGSSFKSHGTRGAGQQMGGGHVHGFHSRIMSCAILEVKFS